MADSLREQLLKAGLVKSKGATPKRPPRHGGRRNKPARAADKEQIDLARAYALRERAEADERAREKAAAKTRRERRRRVHEMIQGRSLNRADAEHVRHFPHQGKIRRIHVDDAQRQALNEGTLAVVYSGGGYVLVAREIAEKIRAFASEHVAVLVEPGGRTTKDGIPDDLIW
jgi:uncharacterized protein YaiL (DUF2058 family)